METTPRNDFTPRDRFGPAEPENASSINPENPRLGESVTGRTSRQGTPGRPILYVLIAGLILGAIYLIGLQIWSGSENTPPAGMISENPGPAATPPGPALTDPTPAPAAPIVQ